MASRSSGWWLIEQQQIRLRDERPREKHAAAQPGQRVDAASAAGSAATDHSHAARAPPITLFQLGLQLPERRGIAGVLPSATLRSAWW